MRCRGDKCNPTTTISTQPCKQTPLSHPAHGTKKREAKSKVEVVVVRLDTEPGAVLTSNEADVYPLFS